MDNLLTVTDLRIQYGEMVAIDSLSFHVGRGEVVALVGANGAGKSSTLKGIMGLVPPVQGRIKFDGRDITRTQPWDRAALGLGYVPEGRRVLPSLTIEENLLIGGMTQPGSDVPKLVQEMYDRFPVLAERRRQRAGTLSGGEQQLLAIARALMLRPSLLIVDEASLGLMPLNVDRVFEVFKSLRDTDLSLLLVEQSFRRVMSVADRIIVMETGSVRLAGTADEIGRNTEVIEAYLGTSL